MTYCKPVAGGVDWHSVIRRWPRISWSLSSGAQSRDPLAPSGLRSSTPSLLDLRAPADLLKRINLIPPVQPHLQKFSCSRLTQIKSISPAVPSPRAAVRDRH